MKSYRYLDLAKYEWMLGQPKYPIGDALVFYTGRDNVNGILHVTYDDDAFYFSYGLIRNCDLEDAIKQALTEEQDVIDLGEVENGKKVLQWLQDAAMSYIQFTAYAQSPSERRQCRKIS